MAERKWNRFFMPTELRNETGRILSGLAGATLHILKPGAIYKGTGSMQVILPDQSADVVLSNPGALCQGNTVYVLPQGESAGTPAILSCPLLIEVSPVYNHASKTWTATLQNIGTIAANLYPNNALVLIAESNSDRIPHSISETGGTQAASTSPIPIDVEGRIESHIPLGRYDLKLTANSWTNPVYIPNLSSSDCRPVSVLDFGAIGDGTSDDTAAIQAALDYVGGVLDGGIVKIPAGKYKISGTLSIRPKTHLIGDGIQNTEIFATTASTMLAALGTYEGTEMGPMAYLQLRDMTLDGRGVATCGFRIRAAALSGIYNCRFESFVGSHIWAEQLWDSYIENCFFGEGVRHAAKAPYLHLDAGEEGTDNTNGIYIVNCRFGSFLYTPVYLHGRGYGSRTVNLIYFIGCQWESFYCSSQLMKVEHTGMLFLISCSFAILAASESQDYSAIDISNSADLFFTNSHAHYNYIWVDDLPATTFANGDATPNVSGGFQFIANNTTATNITNFDNGVHGQQIVVRFNTANTTLNDDSTKIRLFERQSRVCAVEDVSRFLNDNNVWHEIFRGGMTERRFVKLANVVGLSINGGQINKTSIAEPPFLVESGDSRGYSCVGFNIIASGKYPIPIDRWKPHAPCNVFEYSGAAIDSYRQNVINETQYIGAYCRDPYITFERINSLIGQQSRWLLGRVDSNGTFRLLHNSDNESGGSIEKLAFSVSSVDRRTQFGGRIVCAVTDNGNICVLETGSTPSVASSNVFYTGNSVATTITQFASGVIGQVITVIFNDNSTIIANSSQIQLAGSQNLTGQSGDTLTLVCKAAGQWCEIGRMKR